MRRLYGEGRADQSKSLIIRSGVNSLFCVFLVEVYAFWRIVKNVIKSFSDMTTKRITTMIELQKNEIPKLGTNPAAGMIRDTLEYHGLTQLEVAKAMKIGPSVVCDILKGRKGVSADFALRFERCLGISAQWLLDLQSQYDFSKAYHAKKALIEKEVDVLDLAS